ncbi:MAG: hypothetical protein R3188_06905, partial [Acidiferrobacterales bacterium]|nr:hypothetical protein [Acidiferrobacterales bacterium]
KDEAAGAHAGIELGLGLEDGALAARQLDVESGERNPILEPAPLALDSLDLAAHAGHLLLDFQDVFGRELLVLEELAQAGERELEVLERDLLVEEGA